MCSAAGSPSWLTALGVGRVGEKVNWGTAPHFTDFVGKGIHVLTFPRACLNRMNSLSTWAWFHSVAFWLVVWHLDPRRCSQQRQQSTQDSLFFLPSTPSRWPNFQSSLYAEALPFLVHVEKRDGLSQSVLCGLLPCGSPHPGWVSLLGSVCTKALLHWPMLLCWETLLPSLTLHNSWSYALRFL